MEAVAAAAVDFACGVAGAGIDAPCRELPAESGAGAATGWGAAADAAWPGSGRAGSRLRGWRRRACTRGFLLALTLADRSGSWPSADEMVEPCSSSAVFSTYLVPPPHPQQRLRAHPLGQPGVVAMVLAG